MTYLEYNISKLNGGLSVMKMVDLVEEIERFEQE